MDIKCITLEDVKLIHKWNIEYYGGSLEYFSETENKVESILSQQYGYFGHDEYPSVYEKSAMLLYLFIKGHCFVDGNKRVGISTMFHMFEINGFVEVDIEYDWYKLTLEVATSNYRQSDIKKYIRQIARFLMSKFVR